MIKQELRKVSYNYGQGTIFRGRFHEWKSDGKKRTLAIIEDEAGFIREIPGEYVHFD